ncbi:uncharacterized protein LOC141627962 [Silene latifolia]|uniref:uncharacterized protein LOC141627962 n=1 Tax=Silene latifolia TaxID=37657 RepID=UPI003D7731D5
MFLLPNGVIHRIEAICRNFIWYGGIEYTKTPLVSWEKICKPKEEGGLGLKDDILWNRAAVGKLVWWVTSKSDHLWVKWVNHTYIKNNHWHNYSPPTSSSWYWRKICQVKEVFREAYQQNRWITNAGKEYTISKGYEYIRVKCQKVDWHRMTWNKWTIPKHSFIAWIYKHKNMNTNDKLHNLGISTENTCCLCAQNVETLEHLFFDCGYSRKVIDLVSHWIRVPLPRHAILQWSLRRRGVQIKVDLTFAVINAFIYHVWRQRNLCKYGFTLTCPRKIALTVETDLKIRLTGFFNSAQERDKVWIRDLLGTA